MDALCHVAEREAFNYTPKDVSAFSNIRRGFMFTQILLVACGSTNPFGIFVR